MDIGNLPRDVLGVIEGRVVSEFATVSAAGVPIDTPTYVFPTDDLSTIDIATGLSYPAKAERARRNPKVGLFLEGGPGEPVVLVRGYAAVRDANLQANAERYLAETGFGPVSYGLSWQEARGAVWYWTRIIVQVAPATILWWADSGAMDGLPDRWDAPAGTHFPQSDPMPGGNVSPSPQWPQRSWQELAQEAVGRGAPAHLTLCDTEGWPLPVRVRSVELTDAGFDLLAPRGVPWCGSGKASLTFQGVETFIGDVTGAEGQLRLAVERALPQNPMVVNQVEVLQPSPPVRSKLLGRLEAETARRGQPIPTMPDELPEPTRLAKIRQARMASFLESMSNESEAAGRPSA